MAKLLKQVWKTFYGAFYETELEAKQAERHYHIAGAVATAFKASVAESHKEYERKMDDFYRSPGGYSRIRENKAARYQLPPKFEAELIAALEKSGVLPDLRITEPSE